MAHSSESTISVPSPLIIVDSPMVINNIKVFKEKFGVYLKASGIDRKNEKLKAAILLSTIGRDAFELLKKLNYTSENATVEDMFKVLLDYYELKFNVFIEQFFQRKQEEFESFDSFLRDVKSIAQKCDFGRLENNMIKVRVVLGLRDRSLQERLLLRAPDLTLDQIIEHCKLAELAKHQ